MTTKEILVNSCKDCPFNSYDFGLTKCVHPKPSNNRPCLDVIPENCPLKISGITISLKDEKLMIIKCCNECDNEAVWVRRTQFTGDHPYCEKCANNEKDFKKEDPSYFFWKKLPI